MLQGMWPVNPSHEALGDCCLTIKVRRRISRLILANVRRTEIMKKENAAGESIEITQFVGPVLLYFLQSPFFHRRPNTESIVYRCTCAVSTPGRVPDRSTNPLIRPMPKPLLQSHICTHGG